MALIADRHLADPQPDTVGSGPSRSIAFWLGLTGLCAAVLLGVWIFLSGNGALPVDTWWHDLMRAWRTDVGLVLAHSLEFIGGVFPMIVAGIAVVVGFLVIKRPWSALTVVLTLLASQAVTILLKDVFARPRPADSLTVVGLTSYPSGHTTLAATLVIIVALLVRQQLVWVLAAAWVVMMAWSRTFLEAHWLTDTIGGALLGAAVALLMWSAVATVRRPLGCRRDRAWIDQRCAREHAASLWLRTDWRVRGEEVRLGRWCRTGRRRVR